MEEEEDEISRKALYSYEDETDDLTLAASGSGGLAEITLTFDSSRVMYGFCSLKEPTAALPRYILINWVGEDVPDARKCACASHVAIIADFFQGVEVTINASSLDDIDPSAIGQRLTNGTTAVASPVLSRLRTREDEHGDVGTIYEKTNAEVEMKKINREEFWEQAKREEELRKEEERRKVAEERQRFEEERMELERKEQENREQRYRERERQIEEHRRERKQHAADPSIDDLNLEKKETEVEEAKAIIAQRSGNPREFFKQKERALTCSLDTLPVSIHRTGRLDSPFLRQQSQHSPCSSSPTPLPRGVSPLLTPPHARTQLAAAAEGDDTKASTDSNMAAASPIPKIITTPIKDDLSKEEEEEEEEDYRDSVAPRARDSASFNVWESGHDSLVDLWDSSATPAAGPAHSSNLVDLMNDGPVDVPPAAAGVARPQPLLSFDEMTDASFCSGPGAEDDPSSLVDVTGSDQMTLSYQHALQHASGEGQELDDRQLLMTNGEMLMKEGTQSSEGYFSQSQEEEFGQSEECSAKPAAVFYNKPPEIDITCWDTDPVVDDDDD
ncbi:hypothetical protein LDENG_00161030 [Lucifuga dentata]|nr:hypothetical protein LDENG_00161030 [Lucifuga dentata]